MIPCHRCSESLTSPKFHDGKPYGYGCYSVVTGTKPKKDKSKWIAVSINKDLCAQSKINMDEKADASEKVGVITLSAKCLNTGKPYSFPVTFTHSYGGVFISPNFFQSGESYYVRTHDSKGAPVFKGR